MEHGKIEVIIREDYPGAQWWDVTIVLPGYGGGKAARHKLVREDVLDDQGARHLIPVFRPEYAKAIKKGLESA